MQACSWEQTGELRGADKSHQRVKGLNNLNLSNPPKMKTLSVAVAVAVVLAFICLPESSAVPVTEVQELEEPMSDDNLAAAHEDMSVESWKMPYNNRQKRGIECRFCCGCCTPGVCGVCCRF